ncbi:MAG: HEPN domain-containing protein [Desulfohalobiaceae bacterium]
MDIQKQIVHWQNSATEDLAVAKELIAQKRIRHGLFFGHLALEKILKAHVCTTTNDIAPPLHNLIRLAELAELSLSADLRNLLAEVTPFNIEARYPDLLVPAPTYDKAQEYIKRIEEAFQWMNSKLAP